MITLSDTRNESNDTSGQRISTLLRESNHTVAQYKIIHDDATILRHLVDELLVRSDVDVILTNGGTGISKRDQTIGALEKLLDQPLPGFGELFRMLSYAEIGPACILSRAVGGLIGEAVVLVMPGSRAAVELAMSKIILPELPHIVREARKKTGPPAS